MSKLIKFKYDYHFRQHNMKDCPPSSYQELDIIAYRYVFDNLEHENNFKPVFLIHPEKVTTVVDLEIKCKGFGLSFFREKEGACENYQLWMKKTNGNFANIVGDNLAKLNLETFHGVASKVENKYSHFTFHEYAETDLKTAISGNIEKIETP